MRVFYVDEEDISKRRYYVKIDNVSVPDNLKGYKAIEAESINELKEMIIREYGFDKHNNFAIELWSGQNHMGKRLDILEKIPTEIEFIWVRIVNKI